MSEDNSNVTAAEQPIQGYDAAAQSGSRYLAPFAVHMGDGNWHSLGDAFGLTQFGVNLETLQPGAQSALRHRHALSNAFVHMLSGELTLRTNAGEFVMRAGMCVGSEPGDKNAHHLVNRSAAAASFIVPASRVTGDNAFYPDDDFAWFHTEAGKQKVHKDGMPYGAE